MATFNITKGDHQIFPFRVTDPETLADYRFIFTIAGETDGEPWLTKDSDESDEIDIDIVNKDVNVIIQITDFDYDSTVEPGTYHYHLIAIYDDGSSFIPRTIDKGTIVVTHSQYYKHE